MPDRRTRPLAGLDPMQDHAARMPGTAPVPPRARPAGPRRAPLVATLLLAAGGHAVAGSAAPQDPPARDDLIAAFRRLPAAAQAEVVRRIEQRLQGEPDPVRQRITALAAGETPPPA